MLFHRLTGSAIGKGNLISGTGTFYDPYITTKESTHCLGDNRSYCGRKTCYEKRLENILAQG